VSVLAEATSTELVIPVPAVIVHRTVERMAENVWVVTGWSAQFSAAFAAVMALRDEVERTAAHPVRIVIRWRGVPPNWTPPSTGTEI
jgi:hypothetical protein